jgi:hypothetical protein
LSACYGDRAPTLAAPQSGGYQEATEDRGGRLERVRQAGRHRLAQADYGDRQERHVHSMGDRAKRHEVGGGGGTDQA